MRLATPALAATLAAGCHNACQKTCFEMADYAEECGYTVTDADIDACVERQKGAASREDRAVCRDFNDLETIRDEWSCEDLADYMLPAEGDPPADTGA